MAIAVQPYTEDRVAAVKAFNQRLAAGGILREFQFPESSTPYWLPPQDGRRIYQKYFLAVDGDTVRGAFILKYQDFWLKGQTRTVVYYHLPVSEGIVNKAYASVGVHMLRSAMKLESMLFALGMGGMDRPLPQMLKAMGWKLCAVPFYFRIHHPARFLREISPLRQTAGRRLLANLAASTGAGWLGIKALHGARTRSALNGISVEPVQVFGSWADDLWQGCRSSYLLIAGRDLDTLNVLYPAGKNFHCLRVSRGQEVIGWAVALDTQMQNNKYFGNLRLGSLADALTLPENAPAVIQAATRFLEQRGVDLVISNHSHASWSNAFRSSGFLEAPSNFIFAASKPLTELIAPFDANQHQVFFTRGDGDGPVNL